MVLSGNTGVITALRWHPQYGHLLASSSLDNSVRLWSVFPKKESILTLHHMQGVKDIRWSMDGHTLYSGGLDYYLNVIDAETGAISHSYKHAELIILSNLICRWVTSLCAHPTNPFLFLSGGQRRGIVCWDSRISSVVCEYYDQFGEVQDMTFLDVGKKNGKKRKLQRDLLMALMHPQIMVLFMSQMNGDVFVSTAEVTKRNSADKGIIAWDFRTVGNDLYL